jgi:mycoredoxin
MPNPAVFPVVERITVYGANWCGDCRRTKRWLDASGTPYTWIDRDADPALRARLADAGYLAIPIVLIPGGTILVEPSNAELATAIAAASSA